MSQTLFPDRRVLWMDFAAPAEVHAQPSAQCCAEMTAALLNTCAEHPDPFDCADMVLCHSPMLAEYGLIIHDGGASYLTVDFCPFCGTRLPGSRRDAWFDALEAMGIEDPFAEGVEIPEAYRSAAWWQTPKETP